MAVFQISQMHCGEMMASKVLVKRLKRVSCGCGESGSVIWHPEVQWIHFLSLICVYYGSFSNITNGQAWGGSHSSL